MSKIFGRRFAAEAAHSPPANAAEQQADFRRNSRLFIVLRLLLLVVQMPFYKRYE
jgi:hypothetical protein